MENEFGEWLQKILDDKGVSQLELSTIKGNP